MLSTAGTPPFSRRRHGEAVALPRRFLLPEWVFFAASSVLYVGIPIDDAYVVRWFSRIGLASLDVCHAKPLSAIGPHRGKLKPSVHLLFVWFSLSYSSDSGVQPGEARYGRLGPFGYPVARVLFSAIHNPMGVFQDFF